MDIMEFLTEFNIDIDFTVIIFLMALGFCIKHIPQLKKVSNDIIPIVIVIASLIIGTTRLTAFTAESIMNMVILYVIIAAIAIGLHQQGKTIFTNISSSVLDKYTKESLKDPDEDD